MWVVKLRWDETDPFWYLTSPTYLVTFTDDIQRAAYRYPSRRAARERVKALRARGYTAKVVRLVKKGGA